MALITKPLTSTTQDGTGSAASRPAGGGAGGDHRDSVFRARVFHHLDHRDDHRVHPGALRGAADAHPASAEPGKLPGVHHRAAFSVRDRNGRLHATFGDLQRSARRTASASATLWTTCGKECRAWRTAPTRWCFRRASARRSRTGCAPSSRPNRRARRAKGRNRRRPRRPPGAIQEVRIHEESPPGRLYLCAPQLVLPAPADGLFRAVPGVLHAELARPHQSQLPAILSRRGPPGCHAQPAGHCGHGAGLRGGKLPAGAVAGAASARPFSGRCGCRIPCW